MNWIDFGIGTGSGGLLTLTLLRLWRWADTLQDTSISESVKTTPQLPHEKWPEILCWQKDDIFNCCDSNRVDEPAPELIAITPDGYAYCWANCLRDNKIKIPVRYLIGRNETLITRQIDEDINRESNGYMELINQFNAAFKELAERDKQNGIAA